MNRFSRAALSILLGAAVLFITACAARTEATSPMVIAPGGAPLHFDRRAPVDSGRPTTLGATHSHPDVLAGLLLLLAARNFNTAGRAPHLTATADRCQRARRLMQFDRQRSARTPLHGAAAVDATRCGAPG